MWVRLGVDVPKVTPEVEGMLRVVQEEAEQLRASLQQTPDILPWLAQKDVQQRWLLLRLQVYRLEHLFEKLTTE